jgi:hypothetical protein
MRTIYAMSLLCLISMPAVASDGGLWTGPCVPSTNDDCHGGYWPGNVTQCATFENLRCEVFEKPNEMCYRVLNPRGCITGEGAHHLHRQIIHVNQ